MTQQPYQHSTPSRPGQMTATMRAVMPTGPKVLRIGVVQGERVVEERIIKQRTHVTVGPSEKNMFVVASDALPSTFRLFELVNGEYRLNFLDGMNGRVALPTGISELSVLKGQARRLPHGGYQVRLTEDSRGKIVIGKVTFLFQFVAPPPVQPRPQLPASVMGGASRMDWPTTMIAAVSFLLHFMAIGAVYSDWLDPVVDDELAVAGLIDSVRSLPPPPPVEERDQTSQDGVTEVKSAAASKSGGGSGKQQGGGSGGPMSAAQVAALTNQLEQLEMETLGALTGDASSAVAGVLRAGDVPTGALDQAAASGSGVGTGGIGDLRLGGGGGIVRPGAAAGALSGIGPVTGGGTATGGSGVAAKVAGPKGNASVGGASVAGGSISNASRVVAGMRAGFRACYQRELASNPDAQGSIRLTIRVGADGLVQSVSASPSGNLGSAVACVQARAQAAQFDPPEGGSATVVVPVTFVKQ